MPINQALMFFTALSLHTGFGFVLGILASKVKKSGYAVRWIILAATYLLLIYVPSSLVIMDMYHLSTVTRGMIIGLSSFAAILPVIRNRAMIAGNQLAMLRNIYPAICMLLLALWSLFSFSLEGTIAGAPLALSATLAGLAALQRQYEPG